MKLWIQMELDSDGIFGSGKSRPGGEDICVQADAQGFPYMKGSTIRGIFREELINHLCWQGLSEAEIRDQVTALLGEAGYDGIEAARKLRFTDLTLLSAVRQRILAEEAGPAEILGMFTYLRTFTALEDGMVKEGSLRIGRCIKRGLHFYGAVECAAEDTVLVREVMERIKWVGTMRGRGFGKVRITVWKGGEGKQ